jgi:pimeloyl-ACP methyl ester carboxylesterase
MAPTREIHYAKSGDISIAYTSFGEGPMDIVVVAGFVSHLEIGGENPRMGRLMGPLTRFARITIFDKRGMGMSDPVDNVPLLEERMDDVRVVMDAAGIERAALIGFSEGAPLAILFAAAYPQRVQALVLYGGLARSTWAPDYPWANTKEALMEAQEVWMRPMWGTGGIMEIFAPSVADDPEVLAWAAKLERHAASPGMLRKLEEMFFDTDVRDVLPLVRVPTLVIHRHGDRVVNVNAGRYMAEHIPGSKFVELPGADHAAWAGDTDAIRGEIEEFLTGARSADEEDIDRVLATVMFVDLVGSTEKAAAMGDKRWRELLDRYYAAVRIQLERFRGNQVKTIGDGVLATFDGPARAVRAGQGIVSAVRSVGMEVRVGLHSGEVELMDKDVGGLAVHIGARVGSIAGPGEVLVSSTVKDLVVGSSLAFEDHGVHKLKGVPGEWRLFAVVG